MSRLTWLSSLVFILAASSATAGRKISQLPNDTGVDPSLPITYFGGTTWNPDSLRWEALQDSVWTFDSGVGSHFDHSVPGIQPKPGSLHALMEGWVGINRNYLPTTLQFFRRLSELDFAGAPHVCVGTAAGLEGSHSMWAGLLPAEAVAQNYVGSMGYGNLWNVWLEKSFLYGGAGAVTLSFDYVNDTEDSYDFSRVKVGPPGLEAAIRTYTGPTSAHESITLTPGVELPNSSGPIVIRFQINSDAIYSDEDGVYSSACGAFAVDDISLTGSITDHSTFESGDDGWTMGSGIPEGMDLDWSNIVALSDLPSLGAGPCALQDSVLVFTNLDVGGHLNGASNVAASPWIDLKAAGLAGAPMKLAVFDFYGEPILGGGFASAGSPTTGCPGANNTVFIQVLVQWFPFWSPAGTVGVSPWMEAGSLSFNAPRCTAPRDPFRVDLSPFMYAGAEQVRLALGMFRDCFPNLGDCPCQHPSPYFDNVRFEVVGSGTAPPPPAIPPSFDLGWGSSGTGPGQFTHPLGIAVDAHGNVYVADNHRIQKFTASGIFIKSWGSYGTGPGQFDHPSGLAIDAHGHLYVADFGNDRIQKFTTDGGFLFSWSTRTAGEYDGPVAVTTDAEDNVYVVDDRVKMFSSRGGFLASWGSDGSDIKVGQDGRIFVADNGSKTITVYTREHTVERRWRSSLVNDDYPGPPPNPAAIFLTSGGVQVGDRGVDHITRFSAEGFRLAEWGSRGTGDGQFTQIGFMASDPSERYLYVTDFTANRIQRFAYAAAALADVNPPVPARVLPPFPNPSRGQASLVVILPQSSEHDVRAEIFDLSGRRVGEIPSRRMPGGKQKLIWDGRTEAGGPVGAGLYLVRVNVDGRTAGTAKLIYLAQ